MERKYNEDVVDVMIEGLKRVQRDEYKSADHEKEMRKMGARMYKIGIRLTHPYSVLHDGNVSFDWQMLNKYLNAAAAVYCEKAWAEHEEECRHNPPHFDKGIYIMAYGYQLGIRAERERRKGRQAKEKAAKRGNAGRQNQG